ncbi:MAG: ATP-binding protein [uncultured Sulfurovum sp.]|uniref:ATP-binding protein n=1 Tax=uncultured Sulfurovum sp. TaxID=269237 RepID=A0A6S6U1U9_9BACT|nr:MAG: ATP-binding protein [uncultured Sulfurovum sp.]
MLHILCGKMASGKTTLSKKLRDEHDAILISEDIWLAKLYGEEISSFEDYIKYTKRLRETLFEHVIELLDKEIDVVLDFSANTVRQRAWFRKIFEMAGVEHTLHYIVASDALCKKQLKQRSKGLPKGSKFITEEEFDMITQYFEEPLDVEGFNINRVEK